MPLMISRIGHARGRPVFFAAGRWGAITHHSLSVTSVWYRFVSRICCIRVVGVHMVSPGLVSATPWNHADASHSTSFETASKPGDCCVFCSYGSLPYGSACLCDHRRDRRMERMILAASSG